MALGMSVRSHPPVRLWTAICGQSYGAVRGPCMTHRTQQPCTQISATGYAAPVRFQNILQKKKKKKLPRGFIGFGPGFDSYRARKLAVCFM